MEETPSVISQLKHILHLAVVQICKNFVIYHKTLALRGSIVLSADDQELCVISFDEFIYSANDIIFFESVNSDSKRGVKTTEAMSDVQAKKNTISMVSEPKHALSSFTSESHKFKKRSISNQFLQFKEHGEKDEQNLRLFCCPICHKEFTLYKTYIRHQRNFHNKSASQKKKKLDCIEIVPEATRCGIVFEGDSGLDASSLLENGCDSLNSNKFYGCIDHHADTDVYGKMNLQYNTADCNMKSQDDFKKVQRIYLSIEDIMCSTGSQDNDSSFGIPKQNGVDSGVLTTDAFHDDVHSDKSAEISWSDDDVQGSLLNVEDLETMTSPGGMDNPPGLSSDGEIMAMPFCDNFELNNFMRRNPANILDRSRQDSFLEHNRPDSILDQSRPNNILEYESSFVNGCFQGCLNQSKSDNEDGPICKSNDHLKQSASSENFPESIPGKYEIHSNMLQHFHRACIGYGGGIQLPLKRFPDSSVSSLILTGWRGRTSRHQKLAPLPVDGWING